MLLIKFVTIWLNETVSVERVPCESEWEREQRQLECRLRNAHAKWEMSMSWRSLKQNILIEFGKRMTLWILLTHKTKNRLTLFLETKYRMAAGSHRLAPLHMNQIFGVEIRRAQFCTQKVNFSELKWFPRRQQNDFVPFESAASQNWLPNHFAFYAQLWRKLFEPNGCSSHTMNAAQLNRFWCASAVSNGDKQ